MIKFETIQRRAVRVLYKIKNNRNTNTGSNYITNIMLTLGWLRYRDLCKLKLLCLAHKAIYTGAPTWLNYYQLLPVTDQDGIAMQ